MFDFFFSPVIKLLFFICIVLIGFCKIYFCSLSFFKGVFKVSLWVQKGNQRLVWLLLDVGCARRERWLWWISNEAQTMHSSASGALVGHKEPASVAPKLNVSSSADINRNRFELHIAVSKNHLIRESLFFQRLTLLWFYKESETWLDHVLKFSKGKKFPGLYSMKLCFSYETEAFQYCSKCPTSYSYIMRCYIMQNTNKLSLWAAFATNCRWLCRDTDLDLWKNVKV